MSVSKEILINITPQETRVAILENGMLHELYIERSRSRGLVGNVYMGRVARVLPGMEALFGNLNRVSAQEDEDHSGLLISVTNPGGIELPEQAMKGARNAAKIF